MKVDPNGNDAIIERLDLMISLLVRRADEAGDDRRGLPCEILKLCDYDHTTDEIAQKLGKKKGHIHKELCVLRTAGRIRTVKRGVRVVHVRI